MPNILYRKQEFVTKWLISNNSFCLYSSLAEVRYDSVAINVKQQDGDYPLSDVNILCYLLKKFLNSHSRFDRRDLQNYLNLFSFMVNKPYNKLEKVKILLDKTIRNPKALHYRDFYSKK